MEKIEIENYRGSLMRERYDDEDIPSRWRHCIRKFFDDQMIKLGRKCAQTHVSVALAQTVADGIPCIE